MSLTYTYCHSFFYYHGNGFIYKNYSVLMTYWYSLHIYNNIIILHVLILFVTFSLSREEVSLIKPYYVYDLLGFATDCNTDNVRFI